MHEYLWKNNRWMAPKMAPIPAFTDLDAQLKGKIVLSVDHVKRVLADSSAIVGMDVE